MPPSPLPCCLPLLPILLAIVPEVELLDHTVSLFLNFFEEPPHRFPPFYIPTSSARAAQDFDALTNVGQHCFPLSVRLLF